MVHRLFASILLSALMAGCQGSGPPELIKRADRAPAIEINADFLNLPAPKPAPGSKKNGKKGPGSVPALSLASLKGKVVVLDFWATWCGPCRMEIPTLTRLKNQYGPKGVEVIGLSVEMNENRPRSFFDEFIGMNGINYPVGLATIETLKNYGIEPIPTTFFIDRTGKVALSFVGVHPEEDFIYAIDGLLSE